MFMKKQPFQLGLLYITLHKRDFYEKSSRKSEKSPKRDQKPMQTFLPVENTPLPVEKLGQVWGKSREFCGKLLP